SPTPISASPSAHTSASSPKSASLSAVQSLVSISIAMPCWYPQEWWTDDPTSPVGPGRSCNSRRGGSAQPDREPRDLVEPEPPVDRLAVGRGLEPGDAGTGRASGRE